MKFVLTIFGLMLVLVFGVMVSFGDPSTTGAGSGGPVFVSGDDAEDHCQGTGCGSLYVQVLNSALSLSQSPGSGILAIGMGDQDGVDALNSWNNPANLGPNVSITTVTGAAITSADFSNFDVIFVPSNEDDGGDPGISDSDLALLNARQADLVHFVNNLGGGLIALTEADADPSLAFGFLPVPLQFQNVDYEDAEPTAALAALAPDADSNNLDHDAYHNIWTGPPGFSGLDVLAVTPEVLDSNGNPSAAILGGAQVILDASPPPANGLCHDDGDDDLPSNPEPVDDPDSEDNGQEEDVPGERNDEEGDTEDDDPGYEEDDDANCVIGGTATPEPCPSPIVFGSGENNCCPDTSPQGEVFTCICPDSAGGDVSAQYTCSCENGQPLDCLCELGTIPPCTFGGSLSADADCDGGVTVMDAYETLVVLSGFESSAAGCAGGDADCSSEVDAKDTLAILAVVAGLEEAATC